MMEDDRERLIVILAGYTRPMLSRSEFQLPAAALSALNGSYRAAGIARVPNFFVLLAQPWRVPPIPERRAGVAA
jgi:hypothetical protein